MTIKATPKLRERQFVHSGLSNSIPDVHNMLIILITVDILHNYILHSYVEMGQL